MEGGMNWAHVSRRTQGARTLQLCNNQSFSAFVPQTTNAKTSSRCLGLVMPLKWTGVTCLSTQDIVTPGVALVPLETHTLAVLEQSFTQRRHIF